MKEQQRQQHWTEQLKVNRIGEKKRVHPKIGTSMVKPQAIVYASSFDLEAIGGGDDDLLVYQTYNFLAWTTIIFNHPCCLYTKPFETALVAQLEINVFWFKVRNGMKKGMRRVHKTEKHGEREDAMHCNIVEWNLCQKEQNKIKSN